MTLAEKFLHEFEQLSEKKQLQVIDFMEALKQNEEKDIVDLMDKAIEENLEEMNYLSRARELVQKSIKEQGLTSEEIKEDIDRLFAELRGYKYETN